MTYSPKGWLHWTFRFTIAVVLFPPDSQMAFRPNNPLHVSVRWLYLVTISALLIVNCEVMSGGQLLSRLLDPKPRNAGEIGSPELLLVYVVVYVDRF